jgi:hypothetical protein
VSWLDSFKDLEEDGEPEILDATSSFGEVRSLCRPRFLCVRNLKPLIRTEEAELGSGKDTPAFIFRK